MQAVALESNEGGQLTERLAGYAQQAPILDAWLARFPTLCKHLPAQQSLPEVAGAVEGVAKQILASKAAVNVLKVCSPPTTRHTLHSAWLAVSTWIAVYNHGQGLAETWHFGNWTNEQKA